MGTQSLYDNFFDAQTLDILNSNIVYEHCKNTSVMDVFDIKDQPIKPGLLLSITRTIGIG
jgi:hypothetical protein